MYLLIDPTDKNNLELVLFSQDSINQTSSFEVKAEKFLECIDNFLESNDFTVSGIEGVVVLVGKGRFTATRIVTTITNTFRFIEGVDLLAVDKKEEGLNTNDVQSLSKLIERIRQEQTNYISAQYSGKPNIN